VTIDIARSPAASGAAYSDAVVVDAGDVRWVHVAGQIARDPAPDDVAGQSEACFRQIGELLEGAGASLSDLVAITVYLTDLGAYEEFAAVRARMLGGAPPASAAVGVASLLFGAKVEIAAVAAVAARS
jgi:enamine deaminase RidA (YjgF/YER057c/UK114 family)